MRVLCIDSKSRVYSYNHTLRYLKEGEIYTVVAEEEALGKDGSIQISYVLAEINPLTSGFAKDRFIPLSDIDETERVDEVLETIFQPVKNDQL